MIVTLYAFSALAAWTLEALFRILRFAFYIAAAIVLGVLWLCALGAQFVWYGLRVLSELVTESEPDTDPHEGDLSHG